MFAKFHEQVYLGFCIKNRKYDRKCLRLHGRYTGIAVASWKYFLKALVSCNDTAAVIVDCASKVYVKIVEQTERFPSKCVSCAVNYMLILLNYYYNFYLRMY